MQKGAETFQYRHSERDEKFSTSYRKFYTKTLDVLQSIFRYRNAIHYATELKLHHNNLVPSILTACALVEDKRRA